MAGRTERCQSASLPWRFERAMSSAPRPAARTTTTARRIHPHGVELDDEDAAALVEVVVGCSVVVVVGRARVVVVVGADVGVGVGTVVGGVVVVVVVGAVVVVVVVVVSWAHAPSSRVPSATGIAVSTATNAVAASLRRPGCMVAAYGAGSASSGIVAASRRTHEMLPIGLSLLPGQT